MMGINPEQPEWLFAGCGNATPGANGTAVVAAYHEGQDASLPELKNPMFETGDAIQNNVGAGRIALQPGSAFPDESGPAHAQGQATM
jgi:hypothetical protein